MDWFRKHIASGSRLALAALAIQFVLAFGHVHPTHALTISAGVIADAVAAEYGPAQIPADDHGDQNHRGLTDICGICAVVAMSATGLFTSSPILHLPEAVALLYRLTDACFAHLDPAHGPFQPRAPPVS